MRVTVTVSLYDQKKQTGEDGYLVGAGDLIYRKGHAIAGLFHRTAQGEESVLGNRISFPGDRAEWLLRREVVFR